MGSAYPAIAADFFAGHRKQRGQEVAFLTGTDEHGQKIEKAAQEQAKTPKAHCDYISGEFKNLWKILEINFDFFVRTSEPNHIKFVTEFFNKVKAQGDIYKGDYEGLYCVSCEDFWLEKDLEKNSADEFICSIHKKKVEKYSQSNYFFRLSKYESQLKTYIEEHPDFILPAHRKNEVLGWIKEGLKDFPISRTNVTWGIPVPEDSSGQVIYVWFDALLGYMSGLGVDLDRYWKTGNQIVHIIGKDILRFHAVYWPAMLMSAGYALPSQVFGHGFLTKDGMKMGKTLGNIIDPIALSERFGAESVKFYFLREIVFGKDGDFTQESFILRLNSDLANNLGNLLSRSLKLINKYFGGKIPDTGIESSIYEEFSQLKVKIFTYIDNLNPYFALEALFAALDKVNAFINDIEPWKILKSQDSTSDLIQKAAQSLSTSAFACYQAAFYLAPVMPVLSSKIIYNLGLLPELNHDEILKNHLSFNNIDNSLAGVQVRENPEIIFQRIQEIAVL